MTCNTPIEVNKESRAVCRKIRSGQYEYKGWIISCVGYYEPDQKVCWEAYKPNTGEADYHGYSKRMVKSLIDADKAENNNSVQEKAVTQF